MTLYVSPAGNDDANGRAAVATGGDGPFQTVAKALDAAGKIQGGARIIMKPGRYELAEPLHIDASHSGTTLAAEEPGKVIVTGGRRLSGFKQDEHNPRLWRLEIPAVRSGNWYFRQLVVNGQRKTRARSPNKGFYRIDGRSPQDKPVQLRFHPGDIKKPWAGRGDVEVVAFLAWADIRMQIREVDEEKHVAILSGNPRPSNQEANAQYWVENAPEFLDSPGEWYLERSSGILSYWSENDEDLNSAEVIAPHLDELVELRGLPGSPVEKVTFQGIEFRDTDWRLGPTGYADTQAAVAVRGDIRATYAEEIAFKDCTFRQLSGYGLDLGVGCKRFLIQGNTFSDLGGGGIRVGETGRPANAAEENHSHRILDNELHALGRVYAPAVGIFVTHSGTNHIAHNHIHDLYYTAISIGWNWGYQETPCRENIVEFNHLHDIGQSLLSDMGGIYTLGIQHGTVLRNNLIHDVNAFTYGGWGLYTDEGSTGIMLENNVVYRCKNAGFHQHYGKENVIRNNIFAFNRENQLMRTRPEPHISFVFTNNIVYFDSGNLLGSDWSNDHYVIDYNVYYDTRVGAVPEKMKFSKATYDEWKARGHDQHSLIADPHFISPDALDFRLAADSPALKLGFKPIDVSTVGVRPLKERSR